MLAECLAWRRENPARGRGPLEGARNASPTLRLPSSLARPPDAEATAPRYCGSAPLPSQTTGTAPPDFSLWVADCQATRSVPSSSPLSGEWLGVCRRSSPPSAGSCGPESAPPGAGSCRPCAAGSSLRRSVLRPGFMNGPRRWQPGHSSTPARPGVTKSPAATTRQDPWPSTTQSRGLDQRGREEYNGRRYGYWR